MSWWLPALLALGLAGFAGAAFERWAAARDRRRLPMPGQYVQVGETLLHAALWGRRAHLAQPVIIMDGGPRRGSLAWQAVARDLGPDWLVLAFDRAGHNWSTRARGRRDAAANLAEQREMLAALHLAPPWLLVAHDTACAIALLHAGRHPAGIVGLVLVDPIPGTLAARHLQSGFARSLWWKVPLARFGLWRLVRRAPTEASALLSRAAKDLTACRAEFRTLRADMAAIEAAPPPAQPCLVLDGTVEDTAPLEHLADWLPRGALRRMPPGATPWSAPEAVAQAIRELGGELRPRGTGG